MHPFKEIQQKFTSLAEDIFFSANVPETQPWWQEFLRLLHNTNEVSALLYWKEAGEYCFEIAFIGHEEKLERRLMHKHKSLQCVDISTHPGWTLDDYERLYALKDTYSLPKAFDVAAHVITRISNSSKKVSMYSAALCHEDLAVKNENISQFYASTYAISKAGIPILDQLPFVEIFDGWLEKKKVSWRSLFDEFFCRLIESGLIDTVLAGYNAQWSPGAQREIKSADQAGIPIIWLPIDFHSLSDKEAQQYIAMACK